jgi:hypothetical protein
MRGSRMPSGLLLEATHETPALKSFPTGYITGNGAGNLRNQVRATQRMHILDPAVCLSVLFAHCSTSASSAGGSRPQSSLLRHSGLARPAASSCSRFCGVRSLSSSQCGCGGGGGFLVLFWRSRDDRRRGDVHLSRESLREPIFPSVQEIRDKTKVRRTRRLKSGCVRA